MLPPLILRAFCKHLELIRKGAPEISFVIISASEKRRKNVTESAANAGVVMGQ